MTNNQGHNQRVPGPQIIAQQGINNTGAVLRTSTPTGLPNQLTNQIVTGGPRGVMAARSLVSPPNQILQSSSMTMPPFSSLASTSPSQLPGITTPAGTGVSSANGGIPLQQQQISNLNVMNIPVSTQRLYLQPSESTQGYSAYSSASCELTTFSSQGLQRTTDSIVSNLNALSESGGGLVQSTSQPPPVGPTPPAQLFEPSNVQPSNETSENSSLITQTSQSTVGETLEVMGNAVNIKEEPVDNPDTKVDIKPVILPGEENSNSAQFMDDVDSKVEVKQEIQESITIKTEAMETDGSQTLETVKGKL